MILLLLSLQQSATPIPLQQAVARAAAEAPNVALATLRTESALDRERQTRAALLPTFGASAVWLNRSFNRRSLGVEFPTAPGQPPAPDLVGPFDNLDARVRASQPLFDWAALARLRLARAQRDNVDADVAVVAEGAAYGAALAYLRAARAQSLLAARVADSLLAADLVRLADAQVAAGVAQRIDGTRARTQLVAARGAVLVARADSARSGLELARALGWDGTLAPADTLGPALAATDVPRDVDSATAYALTHRADLVAEAARHAAALRGVAAISAERLPRVELAADYGVNGPGTSDLIGTGQVGVQVSLPLFDGLRREARIAEQRVATRESDVRQAELRRQVRADVAIALLDLQSAEAQVDIATERLRLGQAELSQARERFAAGVAGNIEVINAQLALLDARDGIINARYATAAARVALARAGGVARRIQ